MLLLGLFLMVQLLGDVFMSNSCSVSTILKLRHCPFPPLSPTFTVVYAWFINGWRPDWLWGNEHHLQAWPLFFFCHQRSTLIRTSWSQFLLLFEVANFKISSRPAGKFSVPTSWARGRLPPATSCIECPKHHSIGELVTRELKITVQAHYIPDKLVSMYRKAPWSLKTQHLHKMKFHQKLK